jgi:predicted protein tyrosine phosphatase
MPATKILFVCGKNRRRSSTAEELFAGMDGIEVSSAGTSRESPCPVSGDLLEWADWVFVMESTQKRLLSVRFVDMLKGKKVVCLNIPDNYEYMQPELVDRLRSTVLPLLRRAM